MKTTNYFNAFIAVAEDSPASQGEIPPQKGTDKTVANIQFDMLRDQPYKYTSDDVVYHVFSVKNGKDNNTSREEFFSKGQPCLRSSPLTKRYGWGIHHDEDGKIAFFAVESKEYKKFAADKTLKQVKAMRSKKA